MGEKVDFYTKSSELAKRIGLEFEKDIEDEFLTESQEYYFNHLSKDKLFSYLDRVDNSLENTSYQVLITEDMETETLEDLILRRRFSDGLVFDNNHNSKTYTQNGLSLKLIG